MEDNTTKELRQTLAGHLDTLKRNLDAVPREILQTKYKKPYDKLSLDIRLSASAYVKQIALQGIRIHKKYQEEAVSLIESAIALSGITKMISEAAFKRQDISEIEELAAELKVHVQEALEPLYARHIGLYVSEECQRNPEIQPELYNDITGCILRNGTWIPLESQQQKRLISLTITEKQPAT